MKIIKITTDEEVTVHDFPIGTHEQQNEAIRKLIGGNCRLYEHVLPNRLYSELQMKRRPTKIPGQCVSMLVDEEFGIKPNIGFNFIGSYLYETELHGNPILGNILLVGEEWNGDGIDFCGIEDSTFEILLKKINGMALAMKATREVME